MNDRIRFGPAGNSDSFYSEGHKRTFEAPAWLQARGLDAFEYSFGHGVRMGEETAAAIREAAQAADIRLSVHLPYFVNLAVQGEEKRLQNIAYFVEGLSAARAAPKGSDPPCFPAPLIFWPRSCPFSMARAYWRA